VQEVSLHISRRYRDTYPRDRDKYLRDIELFLLLIIVVIIKEAIIIIIIKEAIK